MADEFEQQIIRHQREKEQQANLRQLQQAIAARELRDQQMREQQEHEAQRQRNEALLTQFFQETRDAAQKLQLKELLELVRLKLWNGKGELVEHVKGWAHEGSEGATAEYELALVYPFFEGMGEGSESTGDVDTAGNTISTYYQYPIIRQPGISLHITRSQSEYDLGFTHSVGITYTPDPHKAPYTSDTQDPLHIFDNSLFADVFRYNTSKSAYFDFRKPDDIQTFRSQLIDVADALNPQRLALPEQYLPQSPQTTEKQGWLRRLLS